MPFLSGCGFSFWLQAATIEQGYHAIILKTANNS
jgi:hypothetical protein